MFLNLQSTLLYKTLICYNWNKIAYIRKLLVENVGTNIQYILKALKKVFYSIHLII